jgi:sulfur transfer protein SufE
MEKQEGYDWYTRLVESKDENRYVIHVGEETEDAYCLSDALHRARELKALNLPGCSNEVWIECIRTTKMKHILVWGKA